MCAGSEWELAAFAERVSIVDFIVNICKPVAKNRPNEILLTLSANPADPREHRFEIWRKCVHLRHCRNGTTSFENHCGFPAVLSSSRSSGLELSGKSSSHFWR